VLNHHSPVARPPDDETQPVILKMTFSAYPHHSRSGLSFTDKT